MTELCSRDWCNEFRIPTVSEYCGLKLRNEALPSDAKPSVSFFGFNEFRKTWLLHKFCVKITNLYWRPWISSILVLLWKKSKWWGGADYGAWWSRLGCYRPISQVLGSLGTPPKFWYLLQGGYFAVVLCTGLGISFFSRSKSGNTTDFLLAGRSLWFLPVMGIYKQKNKLYEKTWFF